MVIGKNSVAATLFSLVLLIGASPSHALTNTRTQRLSHIVGYPFHRLEKKVHSHPGSRATTSLHAKDDEGAGKTKNTSKSKGVYVRPSGAIERGSGFFVPGLEGPRVRVLFGTVLLGLTALNHALISVSAGLSLEEFVAIGYSLLVLFQAAIEFGKEELIVEGGTNSGKSGSSLLQKDLVQKWNAESKQRLSSEAIDKIQWAAASYLSITPATQMLLLTKRDSILYRLGGDYSTEDTSMIDRGVEAALDQLRQSKGGRLALPDTHPAVVALCLEKARTVVLQRIDDDSCWVMSSSDQLLASFTPADLKWLGQLARYSKDTPY